MSRWFYRPDVGPPHDLTHPIGYHRVSSKYTKSSIAKHTSQQLHMPASHKSVPTVVFDLNTSTTCIVPSSSLLNSSRYWDIQTVASVKKANEGPKAGFATVVQNAECGLLGAGAEEVALLITYLIDNQKGDPSQKQG